MPIANCFIDSPPEDPEGIVRAWSDRSGIAADEMTVNLVHMRQGGKRYAVVAWRYLPSLWSDEDVVTLSEGLAIALADVLHVSYPEFTSSLPFRLCGSPGNGQRTRVAPQPSRHRQPMVNSHTIPFWK